MDEPFLLPVSLIRQYQYCPRVPYWSYCVPLHRPTTYKMQEGALQHEHTAELEERRSLRAYGLTEGVRHFGVSLISPELGMRGKMDMIIELPDEVIPVEWKHTERGELMVSHRYQLAMYALLSEARFGKPARRCFVYLIPLKRAVDVPILDGMRRYAHRIAGELREMLLNERMPPPTARRGRCRDCEFRRFCNDIEFDTEDEFELIDEETVSQV
jgi:CRISPR-associated exonuclease Cas4